MPRLDYKRCRDCGRSTEVVGPLSHTRLCEDCGQRRLANYVLNQHAHEGPEFLHWRRSIAASVGAVLLDDVLPQP